MDDTVREVLGVLGVKADKPSEGARVVLTERANRVQVDSHYEVVLLTPPEARRLARCLHRLARRVEQRGKPAATIPAI